MLRQAKAVRLLPLKDRLEFYTAIIMNCRLHSSAATHFVDIVGEDAEFLRQDLINLTNRSEFMSMTLVERSEIETWIGELKVVVDLMEATPRK